MSCPVLAFERVRSPPSAFRLIYWNCAVIVSAFGIAAFAKTRVDPLSHCSIQGLILACGQAPAHLFLLNRYRLGEFNEHAPKPILETLNPKFFYLAINACNVGLCTMLILGIAYIIGLGGCDSGPKNVLYGLEAASLFVWALVLIPRFIALALGKTQQWYYLRWSDSLQQQYVDSFKLNHSTSTGE